MKKNEDIFKVSTSKAFFTVLLAAGALFAVLGLFYAIVLLPYSPTPIAFNRFFLAGALVLVLGFAAMYYLLYGINSLFFEKGIVVSDKGLKVDNGTRTGYLIGWEEIVDLKIVAKIYSPLYLKILIAQPNSLISDARGLQKLQLKMTEFVYINQGENWHLTPVKISASTLNCKFRVILMSICNRYYDYLTSQRKRKMKTHIKDMLTEYIEIRKVLQKIYFSLLIVLLFVVALVVVLVAVLF